jgi:hypothetical protein
MPYYILVVATIVLLIAMKLAKVFGMISLLALILITISLKTRKKR